MVTGVGVVYSLLPIVKPAARAGSVTSKRISGQLADESHAEAGGKLHGSIS